MEPHIKLLIDTLKDEITEMSPEDRLEMLAMLQEDFCRCCGYDGHVSQCSCWNDE